MASGASIKSTSTVWKNKEWKGKEAKKGSGFYIEGEVVSWRYQSIHLASDIERYVAIQLKGTMARRRTFDARGEETEPPIKAIKLLRTGYLVDSFVKTGGSDPSAIFVDELCKVLGQNTGKALPEGYCNEQLSHLHPTVRGVFEFWGDISIKNLELAPGVGVRLRTAGETIFIESIIRSDKSEFSSYSGGEVLSDWNKALQHHAENSSDDEVPGSKLEGAADDEWD